MAAKQRVVGAIQFGGSVGVTLDCLGTSTSVAVGQAEAVLHLPRVASDKTDELGAALLEPPSTAGSTHLVPQHQGSDSPVARFKKWGLMSPKGVHGSVYAMAVEVELDPTAIDAFRRELELFLVNASAWIEAATGQLLEPDGDTSGTIRPLLEHSGLEWYGVAAGPPQRLVGGINLAFQERTPGMVLELADWAAILAKASAAQEPPASHRLLSEARRAEFHGNETIAVVHAATAVELALSTRVEAALTAHLPDEAAGLLIKQLSQVQRHLDLAKALGLAIPDRVQVDVIEPRNHIVHRGDRGQGKAHRAIAVAREAIDALDPISL